MDAKHTPGPWTAYHEGREGAGYWYVVRPLAGCEEICIDGKENGEADARLIAAAPDLYVIATHPVLEHLIATSNHPSVAAIFEPMRRAALAKTQPA